MNQPESALSATTRISSERIHSIDQFRGYTVLGMFVVNFLGHYPAHYNYHHNDYFLVTPSMVNTSTCRQA